LITVVVHNAMPEAMSAWGLAAAILITAAVFDPLKRRIQGWVDRAFDRHRYDYRKALVEFGRGLGSQTDLQALLNSIVEQLPRTLLVARVAIFLAQDSGHLRLAASHGLPDEVSAGQSNLALGFLSFDRAKDHSHIFLENAQLFCICRRTSSAPLLCLTSTTICLAALLRCSWRMARPPAAPSP
jgi:two-component system, NtrC family, sensor kinase